MGLALVGLLLLAGAAPAAATTRMTWADLPQSTTGSFARALAPPQFRFPEDFGPHTDFQTEWWYTTGNLETAEGRPFGFQFTVFRQALAAPSATASSSSSSSSSAAGSAAGGSAAASPEAASSGSASPAGESPAAATGPRSPWRTPQIYSAHVTVSDIAENRFHHRERFARGALGLAGAEPAPLRVWLNDWELRALDPQARRLRLAADAGEMAINLEIGTSRAPVLQGERGLSRKGPEPGNASFYYSLIQQPTSGSLRIGDRTYTVTGVSWTDHEIFTNSLSPGTVGWDWFSAQFDDGSALMLYDLRHEGGGREAESSGLWIPAGDGAPVPLSADDLGLTVSASWRSPHSAATYPAGWRLQIPRLDLALAIEPAMADQELSTTSATYWEGAVRYRGHQGATALRGRGYVELTGYADRLDQRLAARPAPADRGE
jgi:predicted secreted hydrolase